MVDDTQLRDSSGNIINPAKEDGNLASVKTAVEALPTNVAQETGGNLADIKGDIATIKDDIALIKGNQTDKDQFTKITDGTETLLIDASGRAQVDIAAASITGALAKETGGNLASIKAKTDNLTNNPSLETGGNLASIKAKTDNLTNNPSLETGGNLAAIKTSVEKIDDWDDNDRAKVVHENHSRHWQNETSTSEIIKAEENGKIVVLTDFVIRASGGGAGVFQIYKKDTGGSRMISFEIQAGTTVVHSFREGLEGDVFDGSNAGDIFMNVTSGSVRGFFSGYMK